jgi:hypothetical protein
MNNARYALALSYDTGLSALLDEFDPFPDWTSTLAEWAAEPPLDSPFAHDWRSDLSTQSEMTTRFRVECCRSLLEMSETDPDIRWHERRLLGALNKIYEAAVTKVESVAQDRGLDPAAFHFRKPTPSRVSRWLADFEASGEDPLSVCPPAGRRPFADRVRRRRSSRFAS